jgi:CRP/FNR family cyclic AMP-dependent transcriptional regulator
MGDVKDLQPILRAHPFFADMSPAHIEKLAGCAANARFAPGELMTRANDLADKCYIIREGRVALEVVPPGRGAIIIQTLADGDVLGWSWMFPPYTWNLNARPMEDVRAIVLDGRCLRASMEQDHDFGYTLHVRFARLMLERIRSLREQLVAHV